MKYQHYKLRLLRKQKRIIEKVPLPKRTRPTVEHALEVLKKAERVRKVVAKVDEKNLNHLIDICKVKHQNYTYTPYFKRLEKLVDKYEKTIQVNKD